MLHLFDEDKLKGVAYYRFSAEDKQENSIENQSEELKKVAGAAEVHIIESFEDDGVTGLVFDRPAFQAMLDKYVYAVNPPKIDYILFYDASRIGRVQRISKVWRLIGELEDKNIRLGSVDRGIPKGEMTVVDTILLTLDFVMASDYSRLLSNKVILGSIKVAEQGYSAGGCPPYGYVRILLDEQRNRIQILEPGVHKEISNQRVAFEPTATGEADIVKRIFYEFVILSYFPHEIAEGLNKDKILTATGCQWTPAGIIRILTNETYTGTRIYNKMWGRLKNKKHINPQAEWVYYPDAHEAIIDLDTFHKAQERLYWLRPRSRNKGLRQIQAAQSYMMKYVEEVIADFTEDQKYYIRRFIPISYGASYIVDGEKRTCFYVPPHQTRYGRLLLCSISLSGSDSGLQNVYKVTREDLNGTSFIVIKEHSIYFSLGLDELKGAIFKLANTVVNNYFPWLSDASKI